MIKIPDGVFESWAEYLIMSDTKIDIIIHDSNMTYKSKISLDITKDRLITGFQVNGRSNDCKVFMSFLTKEIKKTTREEWKQWIRSKEGIDKFKL